MRLHERVVARFAHGPLAVPGVKSYPLPDGPPGATLDLDVPSQDAPGKAPRGEVGVWVRHTSQEALEGQEKALLGMVRTLTRAKASWDGPWHQNGELWLRRVTFPSLAKEAKGHLDYRPWLKEPTLDGLGKLLDQLGFIGRSRHPEWSYSLSDQDTRRWQDLADTLAAAKRHLERESYLPDAILRDLEHELPWAEKVMRDASDQFKHGKFEIVLSEGAGEGLKDALDALDAASERIQPHFPEVLYGKVYIVKGLRGTTAGSYIAAGDFINLSLYANPDRGTVETLIHEFGHRFEQRFLRGDLRDEFKVLSEEGDRQVVAFPLADRLRFADEWIALLREHREERYPDPGSFLSPRGRLYLDTVRSRQSEFFDEARKATPLVTRFRDDRDDTVLADLRRALALGRFQGDLMVPTNLHARPLAASDYGATNWRENFAECFLAVVLGKPLPDPLRDWMRRLG